MLSRLFIAALWSPAGKWLTSWLLFLTFNGIIVTFPCLILGQVWYLIVSILNLCLLSYFRSSPYDISKIESTQQGAIREYGKTDGRADAGVTGILLAHP